MKTTKTPAAKKHRGFAAMSPTTQRSIASLGGKASHAQGKGHEWTTEAARAAGRLGGKASRGGRGKLPVSAAVAAAEVAIDR